MSRTNLVLLCLVAAWIAWVGTALYILSQRQPTEVWHAVPEG